MESILQLLGVISAMSIFVKIMIKKEREEHWAEHEARLNGAETSFTSSTYEHEKAEYNNPDTFGLMFVILQIIGFQPIVHKNNTLSIKYQGENFYIEFGGMYVRVWEPMWGSIKTDDPDLPIIREAVNATNFNFGPTIVMTKPDEAGFIRIHSLRDIVLHPAHPDNVTFVKAVLDSFFDTKEQVRSIFQKIKTQQMDKQTNRRPIGFTTNLNSIN